ncbi:MAG: hypothetical protein FWC10_10250 [Lentimicrobiaceae bacterium]|nr:hypothetical protein [Lentimicrobiaceae bacterium]
MDTLQKYREKPLYEVPEHYFEQLQYDVMQRVKKEEKQRLTFRRWTSAISAAASVVLIVALSCFIFLNKDVNEHFYVHEELPQLEDSTISLDANHLAEVTEHISKDTAESVAPESSQPPTQPLSPKAPLVADKETIVYLAVDCYVDDFETENFYNTMDELDCYYDY